MHIDEKNKVYKVYSEDQQTTAYHIFKYCHENAVSISNFKFDQGNLDDLFVHYLKKESSI